MMNVNSIDRDQPARRSKRRQIRQVVGLLLVGALALIGSVAKADHWSGGFHVFGGHPGPLFYGRPRCVSDWYGWPGPAVGWSSGVSFSSHGIGYGFGYSRAWPVGWGGPCWGPAVIRETVVVPAAPVVIVDPPPVVIRRLPVRIVDVAPPLEGPDMFEVLQQHAERRSNGSLARSEAEEIRPVSASSQAGQQRSRQFQAEGDRLVREGNFVKGYLRYLEAEREAQDRAEIYFRQAFALVAQGRYDHAVLRLKRGVQVDPRWPKSPTMLDEVYGPENTAQKTEFLQRVADWTDQNVRDPDRLFLMGVLLHCNADPRAPEFLQAAKKWSGREVAHVQAFLPAADHPELAEVRQKLPPPPPKDDPAEAVPPKIVLPRDSNAGPRLPPLGSIVPPEPAARELILPDPINREDAP